MWLKIMKRFGNLSGMVISDEELDEKFEEWSK